MRYPAGPHKRRGRRRRALKAAIIAALLAMLLLASTWTPWTPPAQADTVPSIQELVTAHNLYEVSGDRGFAHEYLEMWPAWGVYIRGEAAMP